MFLAFRLKKHHLYPIDICDESCSLTESIWIDLVNPTDREYIYIYNVLGENLVRFLKLSNIGKTLCFFKEEHVLHIRLFFLYEKSKSLMSSIIISFIICDGRLYTFCDQNISVFFCYQIYVEQYPVIFGNVYTLLLNLFEIFLDYLSDKIKFFYRNLEDLGQIVVDRLQINEYDNMLSMLSCLEGIGWKVRLSLLDIQRAMNFVMHRVVLSTADYGYIKDIFSYIEFLLFHIEIFLKKIHFLIQLIMNFISIEQNRIIKILSVVFLPPTLVASSYGMNFDFMPELRWTFGYPAAVILMLVSGLTPYLYFKYKKWL